MKSEGKHGEGEVLEEGAEQPRGKHQEGAIATGMILKTQQHSNTATLRGLLEGVYIHRIVGIRTLFKRIIPPVLPSTSAGEKEQAKKGKEGNQNQNQNQNQIATLPKPPKTRTNQNKREQT